MTTTALRQSTAAPALTPASARPPADAPSVAPTPAAPSPAVAGGVIAAGVIGSLIGGVVGGAALIATARAPRPARVMGIVEGVELLANPRLPATMQEGRWAVPVTGSLFGVAPNPAVALEHVDQGRLGDCWYVAGMGAIARTDPDYLRAMVRESGDHVIVDFPARSVAVTKELPLRGLTDEPQFAGQDQSDPVYWPAYLEKAQAAIAADGYRSLKGGRASTAFLHLLGTQPAKVNGSAGGPMTEALEALRTNTPVVLSTRGSTSASPELVARMEAINVHHTHAYVPVSSGTNAAGDDTVELFNPWGHLHPTRALTRAELAEMVVRSYTPAAERSYQVPRAASAAS